MAKSSSCLLAILVGCLSASTTHADETLSKEELVARYPTITLDDVADGPIPGFYEVTSNGAVSYVTADGRFLFRGDVIDLTSERNLTEARRAEHRAELLRKIEAESAIVFSPSDGPVEYQITIFTDVDCGYCRQFHRQIAAVNALGIEVRYVSYPRTGPDTESWSRAEAVWCAKDRKAALTDAKRGAEVPRVAGCAAPTVREQYELGREIGVTGTPAIYSSDGVELGGYLPPDELLAQLLLNASKGSAGATR